MTSKIVFKDFSSIASKPENIMFKNEKIFMFGEKYNEFLQVFNKNFSINSVSNTISTNKIESYSKTIPINKGFCTVSFSNQDKYLRFSYLDNNGKLIKYKIIKFDDLNWSEISYYSQKYNNELWFHVVKNDDKIYFVKLNENGKEIETLTSNKKSGFLDFFVSENSIYHLYEENRKTKITILKR